MKPKTIFYCTNCGNETLQWMGKCPACGAWNTLTEHTEAPAKASRRAAPTERDGRRPKRLSQIVSGSEQRFFSGFGELDRVLGGGQASRHESGVVPLHDEISGRKHDQFEMSKLHRARTEPEIAVGPHADEIAERLPAVEHEKPPLHRLSVAAHDRAEIREREAFHLNAL